MCISGLQLCRRQTLGSGDGKAGGDGETDAEGDGDWQIAVGIAVTANKTTVRQYFFMIIPLFRLRFTPSQILYRPRNRAAFALYWGCFR
jgi:hypothetical protein